MIASMRCKWQWPRRTRKLPSCAPCWGNSQRKSTSWRRTWSLSLVSLHWTTSVVRAVGTGQLFVRMVHYRIHSMFKTGAERVSGGSDIPCRGTNRGSINFSAARTSWDLMLQSLVTWQVLEMSAGSCHLSPVTFSVQSTGTGPPKNQ